MDPEIVTLISSGATTLLGLMVTDAWGKAKGAALKVFGRDNLEGSALDRDLEATRSRLTLALESGDVAEQEDLEAEWRSRIRRAVESDNANIDSLQKFVENYKQWVDNSSHTAANITMRAEAHDKGGFTNKVRVLSTTARIRAL